MILKLSDKFVAITDIPVGLIENVGEKDVEVCITDKEPVANAVGNRTLNQFNKLIYKLVGDEKVYVRACSINGKIDVLEFNINKDGEIDPTAFYTKAEADVLLAKKVDIVAGKRLSSNDFTNALKNKLNGIDLSQYQEKTDPSLKTTAKTVSGAINEIFDMIKALEAPTS